MKRTSAPAIALMAALGFTHSSLAGPEPLSSKDKVVQPVVQENCNWTGFYIGAHAGYGGGDLNWGDADSVGANADQDAGGPHETFVDKTQAGLFAGGQVGYNYQFGHFVVGAEGDFSYSDARTRTNVNFEENEPNVFDTHNDWLATISMRVGYAVGDHLLLYVIGGAAFVHEDYFNIHHDGGFAETFKSDETRFGGMVGAGVEYAINCHWSVKVEYNHLFLGTDDIHGTHLDSGIPEPETYAVSMDQDSVQVGLNYRFSGFGGDHSAGMTMAAVDQVDAKSSKAVVQPAMEECNWTGFYVGGHAGYTWGNLNWGDDANEGDEVGPQEPFVDKTQEGLFAGGQLGYNHQFGHFVIGGEGDFSYSEARTRTETNFQESEANVFDTHNDWTGTIALRAGYAAGEHFLLYVIGGAAFVHEDYFSLHHDEPNNPGTNAIGTNGDGIGFAETFKSDETRFGGMIGAGVEYAINCHWSVKAEYNHLFLGTDDIHGTHIDAGIPEPETYVVSMDQDSVQLGLNYRF